MRTNHRPMRLFRPALILMAVLCVAVATPLLAQQTADSTRAAMTLSAQPSTPGTTAPAAQASSSSERFGRIGPSATNSHAAAAGFEGGSNTIVISTVTLLLIIIIVLLIR